MSGLTYFPSTESAQIPWLLNYSAQIALHGPACGISAAEIADTQRDIAQYVWVLQVWYPAVQQFAKAATAAKAWMGTGDGNEAFVLPHLAEFENVPTDRPPGVLTRLSNQIARVKLSLHCSETVVQALGIAAIPSGVDHPTPEFTASVEQGGAGQRVRLNFNKYGHDGVWIEVRINHGEWAFLAIDTVKPYFDESALQAAGTPETREYRMRWWDKSEPHGEYSTVQQVTVGA